MKTDKDPIISVIVPIYQVRQYLNKCIVSILRQTYRNLQVILVDDGSTDGSSDVCDYFAGLDNRVEVYHTNNGGLVSARKFGLDKARGRYIGFVDGDDYIEKEMYRELVSVIQSTDADFVHSGYYSINEEAKGKNEIPESFEYNCTNNSEREDLIADCFFGKNRTRWISSSIWSKLFRTDFIFENYSFVPDGQDYGEDALCLYCCLANCRKIVSVGTAYYNYIERDGSLSNIKGEHFFINEIKLYHELYRINERLSFPVDSDRLYKIIRKKTLSLMINTMDTDNHFGMMQYFFSDIKAIEGKKTIIYGAGTVGKNYLSQMCDNERCDVVCIADKNWNKISWNSIKICSPSDAIQLDYDYIIIAIWNELEANIIRNELVEMGVDPQRIIWEKPSF